MKVDFLCTGQVWRLAAPCLRSEAWLITGFRFAQPFGLPLVVDLVAVPNGNSQFPCVGLLQMLVVLNDFEDGLALKKRKEKERLTVD